MDFEYSKLLTDPVDYPTVPVDETAARKQFQDLFDEMKDAHNAHLKDYVNLEQYLYLVPGHAVTLRENWDWTAALQAALDNKGVIKFPEGIINLHDTVTGYENTMLFGCGVGKTIIKFHQSTGEIKRFKLGHYDYTIKNFFIFDMEIDGGCAIPAHATACVYFKRATNVGVYRCKIYNADDAGIRIDGYGETFDDDAWQPSDPNHATLWRQSNKFTFAYNEISDSYLGIEVEGGAGDGSIAHNNIHDITLHAIRLPSSWDVDVLKNTTDTSATGIWVDRSWNVNLLYNKIMNASVHGIAIANYTGGTIKGNEGEGITGSFIIDSYMNVGPVYINDVTFESNRSDKAIKLDYSRDCIVCNNTAPLDLVRPGNTNTVVYGNKGDLVYTGALEADAGHNGGTVKILWHYQADGTLKANSNSDIIGEFNVLRGRRATPPTAGIYNAGDIILNRARVNSVTNHDANCLGWFLNTSGSFAGTPPTIDRIPTYDGFMGFVDKDNQTTDATITTLATIPAVAGVTQLEISVICKSADLTVYASYKNIVTVHRTGTTVTIPLNTVVHAHESNPSLALTIDVSSTSVRIRGTGLAATTLTWQVSVRGFNS
jgi:parallel beta-helix repeat protein